MTRVSKNIWIPSNESRHTGERLLQTRGFSCAPLNAKPDEIAYINAAMDAGVFIE